MKKLPLPKDVVSSADALPPIPSGLNVPYRLGAEKLVLTLENGLLPNHDKVFIGVDPSLSGTAICVLHKGKAVMTTVVPNCFGMERFMYIRDRVRELVYAVSDAGHDIGGIFVEGFSYGSVGRIADLAQLGGILRMDFAEMGLTMVECPPTTLKKFATGFGHANKQKMMDTAQANYQLFTRDDNKTDAFFLSLAALSYLTVAPENRSKEVALMHKACRVLSGKDPHEQAAIKKKDKPRRKPRAAKKK